MRRFLEKNFVRYLITGGFSAAVDYGSLLFLYHILNLRLTIAVIIAYSLGLSVGFLMSKLWTFSQRTGGHKKHLKEAFLYVTLAGLNLAFSTLVIDWLNHAGVGPIFSKPITIACITLWNYYLYKRFIFKTAHKTE